MNEYLDVWVETFDIVKGDIIRFNEPIYEFRGRFKKPRYYGERYIEAYVKNESYGKKRLQHTFTLEIISSDYYKTGEIIFRKGRNIYKHNPERKIWKDENARNKLVNEKHERKERIFEEHYSKKGEYSWNY